MARWLVEDGIIAWFGGPEWDDVVAEVFQEMSPRVADAARANAIWEDRTGDAREGLTAQAVKVDGAVYLTLFHTVSYGYWLEVIQSGRFAVIMRTLEQQAPVVFREAATRVRQARRGED